MTRLLMLYILIGLVVGGVAAVHEYQDGGIPGNVGSAGAVWVGAACFWPFVVLVVGLGMAAHGIARLVRSGGGS
jgi:hypothetical protein